MALVHTPTAIRDFHNPTIDEIGDQSSINCVVVLCEDQNIMFTLGKGTLKTFRTLNASIVAITKIRNIMSWKSKVRIETLDEFGIIIVRSRTHV